ncbi:MAG: hypothetical protein A3J29_06810 [Acidobacteria bacterium RIFCSPLOWO2_12_FULL_67_14b]|nr:MAG: hypothetical protein A3J29_06810 [Acidobacteria bacterium RIFCSPLOWO2_12_FULL_67_14b]
MTQMTQIKYIVAIALVASLAPVAAVAETRWAIIVSGASGGEKYAEQMKEWRTGLQSALVDRYGFKAEDIRVFVDETVKTGEAANAANMRKVFGDLKTKGAKDDFVLVVLLGHGTYDGDVAKFNLVGPDLTAKEWTDLLAGIPGRLAVVNTTEASFPFLASLTSKGRIVITATDSAAQKYATVFPEYFVKAMKEASSDLDKNGRTSIFEVFAAASAAVKQHYEQRGQLATERALIDDNGDGTGREASAEGPDGGFARIAYLDAENPAEAANPELAALVRRRRALETEAEELKLKKGEIPDAEWNAQFEKLMVELAQVSMEIRKKS